MHEPVLLEAPARLPGTCICGTVGEVIDTKLEVDGYGRVYLCTKTCASQAAQLIGWLPPETSEEIRALTERAETAETKLRELAGGAKITLAEAHDLFTHGVSTAVVG